MCVKKANWIAIVRAAWILAITHGRKGKALSAFTSHIEQGRWTQWNDSLRLSPVHLTVSCLHGDEDNSLIITHYHLVQLPSRIGHLKSNLLWPRITITPPHIMSSTWSSLPVQITTFRTIYATKAWARRSWMRREMMTTMIMVKGRRHVDLTQQVSQSVWLWDLQQEQ